MSDRPVVIGLKADQHPVVVDYALMEARRRGALLRVVHIGDDPVEAAALLSTTETYAAFRAPGTRVELESSSGDVTDLLVAESTGAGLLVLGADELPWMARATGAEIAHDVALTAASPVAIVPRTTLGDRHTTAVVVAVDDDGEVDAPLAFAFEEAHERGEALEIVYGAGTHSDYPGRLAHQDRLEGRVDEWRARYPDVRARVSVEGGSSLRACLDAALHASLLVLGQPAGPHPRLVNRAFASRVVREASSPVALVPLTWAPLLVPSELPRS